MLLQADQGDRLLLLDDSRDDEDLLEARINRAISVVYHPRPERYDNYVPTVLMRRYDAFHFLVEAEAVHPCTTCACARRADLRSRTSPGCMAKSSH